MAFVKYSSELIANNLVFIDNVFFQEFLPNSPENCVKVYLYGLYKCANPESLDNSLTDFARVLNISEEDIISSFYYWEELGLVQVLSTDPIEVRYLPIKSGTNKLKKFNVDKYKTFNVLVQEVLNGRIVNPNEYQEYYLLMEYMHIDADALLMIIKYCVNIKDNKINYPYILSVAKNWAYDGITTVEKVEERLKDLEKSSSNVTEILKLLSIKRKASNEEYEMYLCWTKDMQLSQEVLVYLCKMVKSGGMKKLDFFANKCYMAKLNSVKEISDYFALESANYELAKEICRNLGVRYDNLDIVIETYITKWLSLGFDNLALEKISNMCFKANIKTLEGMNNKTMQMFKLGLLTESSIDDYLQNLFKDDEYIHCILLSLGIDRQVTKADRDFYKNWIYSWNINKDILDYALSISVGKFMPMQYLNKVLSVFYNKKITTLEEAKKENFSNFSNNNTKTEKKSGKINEVHNYSPAQLNSLFDNIYEVEV